jgi:hypothetical protein
MRGFDIREWKALDWAGLASIIALALLPSINAGMKDYPAFAALMPAFISWPYLPVPLVLFVLVVIAIRSREPRTPRESAQTHGLETRSQLPLPVQFEPPSEFKLLPISYSIDLTAQLFLS